MSRIPSLGPRGEGWVVLQFVAIGLVIVSPGSGVDGLRGEPLASLLRVGGMAMEVAGGLLFLWGYIELRGGHAFSILPRPIAGADLVESGPYRRIRNPIYSGLIVGALGVAAARASLVTLLAAGLLFVVLDLKRRREEVFLAAAYPTFEAYRRRTKALIPFLY